MKSNGNNKQLSLESMFGKMLFVEWRKRWLSKFFLSTCLNKHRKFMFASKNNANVYVTNYKVNNICMFMRIENNLCDLCLIIKSYQPPLASSHISIKYVLCWFTLMFFDTFLMLIILNAYKRKIDKIKYICFYTYTMYVFNVATLLLLLLLFSSNCFFQH